MRRTRSKSIQQPPHDVDEQDDSNAMVSDDTASKKLITNDDEDAFITIVLRYIHIVERKKTDHHLTPKVLRGEQSSAWENIAKEFLDKTSVSCFKLNLINQC